MFKLTAFFSLYGSDREKNTQSEVRTFFARGSSFYRSHTFCSRVHFFFFFFNESLLVAGVRAFGSISGTFQSLFTAKLASMIDTLLQLTRHCRWVNKLTVIDLEKKKIVPFLNSKNQNVTMFYQKRLYVKLHATMVYFPRAFAGREKQSILLHPKNRFALQVAILFLCPRAY